MQASFAWINPSACSLTYFTTYYTARDDLVSRDRRIDKACRRTEIEDQIASYLASPFVSFLRSSEIPDVEGKAASTLDLAAGGPISDSTTSRGLRRAISSGELYPGVGSLSDLNCLLDSAFPDSSSSCSMSAAATLPHPRPRKTQIYSVIQR
ncbi:hypothetical protein NA56DRAFT_698736 [Hyaloscypha hepaticicola]|uniref:Uncharacterized protein n=1 Tax=Hyaloscypha hepaticicola TaxID=2082293 RepID=A0A2J6QHE4_9HELO|nr:hypothetical protein NA56DRAFT_698736 [Hyaloscypha hepaticicola]